MSKPNTSHLRTQSEPQVAAKQSEAATSSLLHLVNAFKNVTLHESFLDAETNISLLRTRDQASTQRITDLERELRELKASEEAKLRDLDTQYNLTKREILKTHREEFGEVENKRKDMEQKLSTARSIIEQKEKEVSVAQTDLAQAKKEVDAKEQAIKACKETVTRLDSTIKNYSSELGGLKNSVRILQAELQQSTDTINTMKGFGVPLRECSVDEAFKQFNDLWKRCVDSVILCFKTDLHQRVLQDESAWDNLKQSHFVTHRVPLPATNSVPAKTIRCVVVLAYISRLLVVEIFRVVHLIDRDEGLRHELGCLAQENPSKESFFRSVLISLDDEAGRNRHIQYAAQQTFKQVKDLLESGVADKFRTDLESIFEQAAQIWGRLQASNRHYVADLDIAADVSLTWRTIQLSNTKLKIDERDVAASVFSTDEVELKVFPRLYIIGPKGDISVFPGRVLQQSQTTAARQEVLQALDNAPLTRSMQRRRTSVHMSTER